MGVEYTYVKWKGMFQMKKYILFMILGLLISISSNASMLTSKDLDDKKFDETGLCYLKSGELCNDVLQFNIGYFGYFKDGKITEIEIFDESTRIHKIIKFKNPEKFPPNITINNINSISVDCQNIKPNSKFTKQLNNKKIETSCVNNLPILSVIYDDGKVIEKTFFDKNGNVALKMSTYFSKTEYIDIYKDGIKNSEFYYDLSDNSLASRKYFDENGDEKSDEVFSYDKDKSIRVTNF